MKFEKKKRTNLMGQTEVSYTQIQDDSKPPAMPPLTIIAKASGVTIFGGMQGEMEDRAELDHLAQAVSAAWLDYDQLKKAVRNKLTGGL